MKTIIVTGANQGIGYFLTRTLLEDGFQVVGLDLHTDQLEQLHSAHANNLLVQKCDVTDPQQVQNAVDAVVARFQRIDVLVNNAVLAVFSSFEEKEINATRREFEVNYFGAVNMIKAVLPYMKAQQDGLIHNVSSGVGISGFPGIYGYASTKGAIESLTRTLALEFSPYNITVNLMHPPLTNTQSASPLGIPAEVMDSPEKVGANLAKNILSKKNIIVPDLRTRLYVWMVYRIPVALGRLFASLTEKAREEQEKE